MAQINLNGRIVGTGEPVLIVAEIAQAHEGSLGMAHAYIDAVAATGADAVKFQTHIASEESSVHEKWRVPFSYEDATRYDYWHRMEFTPEQWLGLRDHCRDKGLLFLSSPFSLKAVELLSRCEVPLWKIASGEINNYLLYEAMARTGLPVLISSGMSSEADTERSVRFFRERGIEFGILQCTTSYPCPPELVGLSQLARYAETYDCPVGLSDHSGDIFASLAAVSLSASILEVHVTMSPEMFGPDVKSSVTTGQLTELCRGVRAIERMLKPGFDKDHFARQHADLAATFGQSLVAARDISAGEILSLDMLTCRKPVRGIATSELYAVLGREAATDIPAGAFLNWTQVGNNKAAREEKP